MFKITFLELGKSIWVTNKIFLSFQVIFFDSILKKHFTTFRSLNAGYATDGDPAINDEVYRIFMLTILDGFNIFKIKMYNDRSFIYLTRRNYWLGDRYYYMVCYCPWNSHRYTKITGQLLLPCHAGYVRIPYEWDRTTTSFLRRGQHADIRYHLSVCFHCVFREKRNFRHNIILTMIRKDVCQVFSGISLFNSITSNHKKCWKV